MASGEAEHPASRLSDAGKPALHDRCRSKVLAESLERRDPRVVGEPLDALGEALVEERPADRFRPFGLFGRRLDSRSNSGRAREELERRYLGGRPALLADADERGVASPTSSTACGGSPRHISDSLDRGPDPA